MLFQKGKGSYAVVEKSFLLKEFNRTLFSRAAFNKLLGIFHNKSKTAEHPQTIKNSANIYSDTTGTLKKLPLKILDRNRHKLIPFRPTNTMMPIDYTFLEEPISVAQCNLNLIKICTYNVASLRASSLKGLIEYIQAEDPTIICLQETKLQKAPPESAPFLKTQYPHQIWWCSTARKGYSGTAILSKIKPLSCISGFVHEQTLDKEGRIVTFELEGFYLVNAYAPYVGQELERIDVRVNWEKDVLIHLAILEGRGKPVIYTGDLNVAHHPIDLALPQKRLGTPGFTDQERECFQKLLDGDKALPRVDVDRHFYPNEIRRYTAYSYFPLYREHCLGWRLDYFVASKSLLNKIRGSAIRFECFGASDHVPLVLWIEH